MLGVGPSFFFECFSFFGSAIFFSSTGAEAYSVGYSGCATGAFIKGICWAIDWIAGYSADCIGAAKPRDFSESRGAASAA